MYESANQAVAAVREHVEASNAYLYIEFKVGRDWVLADESRRDPKLSVGRDPDPEQAFEVAVEIVSKLHPELPLHELEDRAQRMLDENPELVSSLGSGPTRREVTSPSA